MFPRKINPNHPSISSPSNALGTSVSYHLIQNNPVDCIDTAQPELQSEISSMCISPQSKPSLPNTAVKNIDAGQLIQTLSNAEPKDTGALVKNLEPVPPSANTKIESTYTGKFKQRLSNAELQDAVDFLKKNTEQSDRLIREYYIPLPKGITHTQALLDCLSNSTDSIETVESVRFICRANYLEECFFNEYNKLDPVSSSSVSLKDLSAALYKSFYVREGNNKYGRYIRGGIAYISIALEEDDEISAGTGFQTIIRNRDKKKPEKILNDYIYIDRCDWEKSPNKLKFLAEKCLMDDKDPNNYPRSYDELFKKALQQSCKEKYEESEAKEFHSLTLMRRSFYL